MKKIIFWIRVVVVLASIGVLIYGGIKVTNLFNKGDNGNAFGSLAATLLVPTILIEATFKKPDEGVKK